MLPSSFALQNTAMNILLKEVKGKIKVSCTSCSFPLMMSFFSLNSYKIESETLWFCSRSKRTSFKLPLTFVTTLITKNTPGTETFWTLCRVVHSISSDKDRSSNDYLILLFIRYLSFYQLLTNTISHKATEHCRLNVAARQKRTVDCLWLVHCL